MRVNDLAITTIAQPLDQVGALRLRGAIQQRLSRGELHHVIDMRQLSLLDSQTVAALIQTLRAVRAAGGSTSLLVDQPQVLKILHITGLDRIFPIYATEGDVLGTLHSQRCIPA